MVKACINGDKTRVVYDGDKEKNNGLKLKCDQIENGDFKRINDLNLKIHLGAQLQILKDNMTGLIKDKYQAWKILKEKGPVNIPVVQEKVQRCIDVVRPYLSSGEWNDLMIARGHSELGEGREEWGQGHHSLPGHVFL